MANRAMDTPADDEEDPTLHSASRGSSSESGSGSESGSPESDGGRESGIVDVERKASAVTGGVTGALASTLTNATSDLTLAPSEPAPRETASRETASRETGRREHDIEIDTDLEGHAPRAQMITQTVVTNGTSVTARDITALDMAALNMAALDDDAIQVSDDEIESAEPGRPTLTSGLPALGETAVGDRLSRSRPPARPSLRPSAASTSLPPPRRSSRAGALLGSSLPPPSFPSLYPSEASSRSERDPWLLANKTLELGRANARISALEDQIAFRDSRIMTLEERLEAAQLKIEELERKQDALPPLAGASAPASGSTGAHAPPPSSFAASSLAASSAGARGASKPAIAIPKPADVAKAVEAKPAPARATNGKRETEREDASDAASAASTSLTPEAPALAGESESSGSIPPEADEAQANGAAAPPSGPEDVRRIADIGNRLEAALRKQGITRISQIAAWSDADVRQVAKALKIPKSRIVKGRWIEAAREMIGSRSTSE